MKSCEIVNYQNLSMLTFAQELLWILIVYWILVPLFASLLGFSLTRELSLELVLYLKGVHGFYKWLLPLIGHGVERRRPVLECIIYAMGLCSLYLYLIPKIGLLVTEKCINLQYCAIDYRRTIWGYRVDHADGQWNSMQKQLWPLTGAFGAMIGIHTLYRAWAPSERRVFLDFWERHSVQAAYSAQYYGFVGLIFLLILHGWHALLVWLLCGLFYMIVSLRKSYIPRIFTFTLVWGFALGVLALKESYRIRYLKGFEWLQVLFDGDISGLYPWQLAANFLVLRMISFGIDAIRATYGCDTLVERSTFNDPKKSLTGGCDGDKYEKDKEDGDDSLGHRYIVPLTENALEVHNFRCRHSKADHDNDNEDSNDGDSSPHCPRGELQKHKHKQKEKEKITTVGEAAVGYSNFDPHSSKWHLPSELYSYKYFLAYMLYPQLYIGGPITSFNAFVYFLHRPQTQERVLIYGLRWVGCLALLELLTHLFPFFSVTKHGLFAYLSAAEMVTVAYVLLKIMWLKFLVIWRFFRAWALLDGQSPPENMLRCMSNQCSLADFWRGWHASYNRWIQRYMYVPLGGRAWQLLNVWPIFLFVAVWHDIEIKLLAWAMLNSGFFMLEGLGASIASSSLFQQLPQDTQRGWRVATGALYIMVLVAVNLVGYGIGVGGVQIILDKLLCLDGLRTLVFTFLYLSTGVCIMSALRREKLAMTSR